MSSFSLSFCDLQLHHSFTLKLQFLYELKRKIRLSKTMREILHFQFSFIFNKVYIFVQQKGMDSLTLKCNSSFQN